MQRISIPKDKEIVKHNLVLRKYIRWQSVMNSNATFIFTSTLAYIFCFVLFVCLVFFFFFFVFFFFLVFFFFFFLFFLFAFWICENILSYSYPYTRNFYVLSSDSFCFAPILFMLLMFLALIPCFSFLYAEIHECHQYLQRPLSPLITVTIVVVEALVVFISHWWWPWVILSWNNSWHWSSQWEETRVGQRNKELK